MIIATAGHIDHGKTSLVKVLTQIDTDRLPEEKKRGISIEPGFAHLSVNDAISLDFVDVPGHEKFIHQMLCGAYACDHLLLIVAADDGVMPQTLEHLAIVSLLSAQGATLVITKVDRVDASRVLTVQMQAQALLVNAGFAGAASFAVSSVTGKGVPELSAHLKDLGLSHRARTLQDSALPRFLIDRVFTLPGSGTVVTGTLMAGTLEIADELVLMPQNLRCKIRRLHRHHENITKVLSGERCAVNLTQIQTSEIQRGDWLVSEDLARASSAMTLELRLLPHEQQVVKHGASVHFHHGALDVLGKIFIPPSTLPSTSPIIPLVPIEPIEPILVQLRLAAPRFAVHGDRFIIRDQSAQRTLGGGRVIDPLAENFRRAPERKIVRESLALNTPEASLRALLQGMPFGVDLNWVSSLFALRLDDVVALLPEGVWCPNVSAKAMMALKIEFLDQHALKIQQVLWVFHQQHPTWVGMNAVTCLSQLKSPWAPEVLDAVLQTWTQSGWLVVQGNKVRLQAHQAQEPVLDAKMWQEVRGAMQRAQPLMPSVRELSLELHRSIHLLRDFLNRYAQRDDLIKVTPERFATPALMLEFAKHAQSLAQSQPNGLFNAAQFRDVSGVGRTLAIEILECLDRLRVTLRLGNERRFLGYEKIAILRSVS